MHMRLTIACAATLLAAASNLAHAELTLNGGIGYFDWRESTSPSVEETGAVVSAGLTWLLDKDKGLLVGYRGQVWGGQMDYNGAEFFTGAPLTGTTDYLGLLNEGQVRYRFPLRQDERLDALLGIGLDIWRRDLGFGQKEDWTVGYARLGVEASPQPGSGGWIGGLGVKYPFYTHENAYLTSIGFDQNRAIEPGKEWSGYANLGYRFNAHWSVLGSYESYRFKASGPVQVTFGGAPAAVYQPKSSMDVYALQLQYTF